MAYNSSTLTGTYLKTDGTPAEGTIEIIPNSSHLVDAEGDVILAGRVKVTLDGTGSFTVSLPATDDATIEPATGRQYTVVAKLRHTHLNAITGVELPGGTTVDVADVAALPVVDPAVTLAATPAQLAALEASLNTSLAGKQDAGDYATTTDIPTQPDDIGAEPAGLSETTTNTLNRGRNIPRTLAKLRAGEPITIGVLGDSKMDPGTTGNSAGTAVDKLVTQINTWSDSTVTVVNEADSGDTMAIQFLSGNVATIAAAAPDLTIIEIGTNDSNADQYGPYAAGYAKEASWAAVERAAAFIRDAREDGEFLFIGTTPYLPSMTTSNTKIVDYNTGIKALATVVGAEWVDGYQAFLDYGTDWTPLLLDSTHRNAAGNDVLADTLNAHFPPTGPATISPALAPRAEVGKYDIGRVDPNQGQYGYYTLSAPTSVAAGSYVLTGAGWTVEGAADVTSTVGASWTLTGTRAVELLANIDLSAASSPVVDVHLDGVLQATSVDLHSLSSKNTTYYWLAPFTGLDGGTHAMKLTLKSGTLKVQSAVVVSAPEVSTSTFPDVVRTVAIASTVSTTTLTTSYANLIPVTTVALPTGWGSMDVVMDGWASFRCSGATTVLHRIDVSMRDNGTGIQGTRSVSVPVMPGTSNVPPMPLTGTLRGKTGSALIDLIARVGEAGDTLQALQWHLTATLIRTS